MKKNTISSLVALCLIVVVTIIGFRISSDAKIANFIAERNILCANWSSVLSADESIDSCYCYYEGFKTGDNNIDSGTQPLCACECVVNGTLTKIGMLVAN
ncbi:MAG: hypothetical protein WC307_03755 [Candidatus Nanoarchaeia archaeon]|jgi:hypothetical protein